MSGQARTTGTGVMDKALRHYRDEDSEHRPVFDRLHQLIVATRPDAEVVLPPDRGRDAARHPAGAAAAASRLRRPRTGPRRPPCPAHPAHPRGQGGVHPHPRGRHQRLQAALAHWPPQELHQLAALLHRIGR